MGGFTPKKENENDDLLLGCRVVSSVNWGTRARLRLTARAHGDQSRALRKVLSDETDLNVW